MPDICEKEGKFSVEEMKKCKNLSDVLLYGAIMATFIILVVIICISIPPVLRYDWSFYETLFFLSGQMWKFEGNSFFSFQRYEEKEQ